MYRVHELQALDNHNEISRVRRDMQGTGTGLVQLTITTSQGRMNVINPTVIR